MGRTKINTYAAMLIITIIGAGASLLIIKTATTAEANSSAYYTALELAPAK